MIVPLPRAVINRAAARATMNAPKQFARQLSSKAVGSMSRLSADIEFCTKYTTKLGTPRSERMHFKTLSHDA
jgi:hypothetical protein